MALDGVARIDAALVNSLAADAGARSHHAAFIALLTRRFTGMLAGRW